MENSLSDPVTRLSVQKTNERVKGSCCTSRTIYQFTEEDCRDNHGTSSVGPCSIGLIDAGGLDFLSEALKPSQRGQVLRHRRTANWTLAPQGKCGPREVTGTNKDPIAGQLRLPSERRYPGKTGARKILHPGVSQCRREEESNATRESSN